MLKTYHTPAITAMPSKGFFHSPPAVTSHAFAVLASLLGTARRQNQPALHFIHTLFTANIVTA